MLKRSGKAHLPLTRAREGESERERERARARKDRSKPLAGSHTSSRNFTPACIVATLRFRIDYVYRSELTSCRERNCFSPLEYDRSMNGPRPCADPMPSWALSEPDLPANSLSWHIIEVGLPLLARRFSRPHERGLVIF